MEMLDSVPIYNIELFVTMTYRYYRSHKYEYHPGKELGWGGVNLVWKEGTTIIALEGRGRGRGRGG